MGFPTLRLHPEESSKIDIVLGSIMGVGQGLAAFLIARTGQLIASRENGAFLEAESLATLAAGNLAATAGLATLIGEDEFERIYHRGRSNSILMFPVGKLAMLLLVVPNECRTGELVDRSNTAVMLLQDLLERRNQDALSA